MAITNYLVHFKTEATYESNKDQLRNDAVAFVGDATIIHTHGTDYHCGSGPVALESDLANYATTSALTSGLASKANVLHTHSISQISGLQEELDSKLKSVSLADFGVTATATELNYVDGVTSNIQTQLNGKAASLHTHTASQVLDLATVATSGSYNDLSNKPAIPSLDGYATQYWVQSQGYLTSVPAQSWSSITGKPNTFTPSAHTHSASDITSGTLAIARIPTGTTSSTVALGNHSHSAATTSAAGFMSAADKIKLNSITSGADSVLVSRNLTSGTQVATITVSGTNYVLYAPTNTDTDTKNTAGSINNSSKLFLIGATTQAANPITYSNSSVYTQSGQLYASQMNATNGFYETSDARLKDFKEDIKALDTVDQIPTKHFTWKEDKNKESQIGTSAQEVEKLYPELVSKTEEDILTVDYAKLSIVALAAIKELKAEIQSLKEEIKQLKLK